jgi:hypothetical protein
MGRLLLSIFRKHIEHGAMMSSFLVGEMHRMEEVSFSDFVLVSKK